MASWIAPALAADYLNVPEHEIRQRIDSGSLQTRYEGDFCFVNVGTPEPLAQEAPLPALRQELDEMSQVWATRHQISRSRRHIRKAA